MAEVITMGKAYHRNLIKLYGYCFEHNMKALVYEYMENGSLDIILYENSLGYIEWETLYNVAIGTAKGLVYLHDGCDEQIIHYDIKAGNVLLDKRFSPKITDFGLAKLMSREVSRAPLTRTRGTLGYNAPETWMPGSQVTSKCDVYSFGMMLFEILGKRNNGQGANWFPQQVWEKFKFGQLDNIIKECGIMEKDRENAKRLSRVALWCTQYTPEIRPSMSEVVMMLENKIPVGMPPYPFQFFQSSDSSILSSLEVILEFYPKFQFGQSLTSSTQPSLKVIPEVDANVSPARAERNSAAQDVPSQSQGDTHTKRFPEEITMTQPSFRDLLSRNEMDDPESAGREQSSPWGTVNSPYMTPTHDDPNSSFYPNLPPVLEEPSSSFSEAGEDDPLPAIDGLQISGEPFPGQELQAGGYSINGTTSCNFEWVRYLEDGSVNYIDGAKQPNYLVTADDADTYLAIEVQPLDNRKRKGELVKVFANEQRKITCDSKMQEQIERSLHSGQTSYEVSLAARYLDIWEPVILAVKREGYSIKRIGTRDVVATEKFLQKTAVTILYGHPTAFSILGFTEHLLRTENSSLRDTIVLTMRLFIMRALEKRKAKKKGIFFNI
ncbi:hypothetical protein AQUCO_02500317v1 [Aquilegia coerulea]|uniref:non-specific serine/threonine protein kinase n=1 Tax=Aquilegia coerulea TaxID=218851 RepID=A0A2G5DAG3_AQUCA|nr:hypothetical protein AQUCO_02500317v1 [Aquilegia coerulea]